ncbi:aminoglycoside phosphotransferase family protein [Streptomyces sp. NBC_00963]|uniref:phosphotransferase n=1 Tax=Streptomyces sp. NBC_00963 TaxID=2903697 RepID=UPI0038680D6A|nr:aminoglycoside phosphotransferase family protein [Streptomyces sp. NBC_00963]
MTEALYSQTGVRLTVQGPCPGGQVGAAYVRWADGRRSVLKWRPHSRLADIQAGPLSVADILRSPEYPAPATELAVQTGHAVVVVQELLPGAKIDNLDHRGLEQALELNRLQTGRLADRPDIPPVGLHLSEDGSGYCLHEPLRRHNRRSAALERWITAVGQDNPDRLGGYDAVHYDFHPGNLLAVGGAITGIVDWDGAGRGDRRLDLVTLRFGIHAKTCEPGVAERLDDVLDALPDTFLRLAWAHMSLRMVDWAIRHFAPADVEYWLDIAEQRAYQ